MNGKNFVYEMREIDEAYDTAEHSVAFVGIESIIIAMFIGILKQDIGWGIGSWIAIMVIYAIPILGGIMSLMCSIFEGVCVYEILCNFTSITVAWFIGIIAFTIFVYLHKVYGRIRESTFGYSLIICENIIFALFIYYLSDSIPLAIAVFIIALILAIVPITRVLEFIALSIYYSISFYSIAVEDLEPKIALIIAAFVLVYTGILHCYAYSRIDYKGIFFARKREKMIAEEEAQYLILKRELYDKYPEIEKKYYYFFNTVCQSDTERIDFEQDWHFYLLYIKEEGENITFNEFFEKKKLYRIRNYNRDFMKHFSEEKEKEDEKGTPTEIPIVYFAGVYDLDALKKRYHDLLKIYHPDNQNGDTIASQQIQQEYDYLLERIKNSN